MNEETVQLIAQIIGIFAAALNILSFQCKSKRGIIAFQLFGGMLFTINFFMIGAITGAIMNGLAIIRALLFLYKDKLKLNDKLLVGGLIAAFLVTYVLAFTVLGVEPKPIYFIIEALPVIGMSAATVSFNMKNAARVRLLGITLSSPSWLIYNVYYGSIGAILCEAISIVSIAIGMIRHDIKRKSKEENTADM